MDANYTSSSVLLLIETLTTYFYPINNLKRCLPRVNYAFPTTFIALLERLN